MKTWKIDPFHSEIKFKVKHLLVSTVSGSFDKFDGKIETENDNFDNAKISFEADANSINTGNEMRDNHLRSADFFDAANNPKITFVSKSFKRKSDSDYELTGDITIRGITKEITLNTVYNGKAKDMQGSNVAGFEITGNLNRFDFGLKWNALTEAGGFTVGDIVKIEINTEVKEENLTEMKEEANKESLIQN